MKRIMLYLGVLIIPFLYPAFAFGALTITYTSPGAFTLGTTITTISPTVTGGTITTGGFSPIYSFATIAAPWDVTVDNAGNAYTISESGNTLIKLSPTGATTTLATTLNEPTGVAIDGVGNIYVSNFGTGSVLKFNTSGTLLATITGFTQPYGVSFDASNNAFVADAGTNYVYKITAGTTTVTPFATGFTGCYGTAVDPSGNVYISEYLANDIIKITTAGVRSTFVPTTGGLSAPRQLGSDAAGNIYVADYNNNAVKKISSAGVVSAITQATGLTTPRSIQTDGAGSIYIADYGNNAIKKIAVTGYVISPALPAGLSFNTSNGQITGTPTVTFASTVFTIIGYNTTAKATGTITLSCTQTTLDWIGTTAAWTTSTNWTPTAPAGTPNQYTAVRIGSNRTFTTNPTISASTSVGSMTFGTTKTAMLTIATGATLTVDNGITVNTGGATPTIVGTGTAGVNMAPGSVINIAGTSTLTLTSPLSFTLQSTAAGDASIGQIAAGAIKGTAASSINVQRYLSAERSYRMLSSPVYNYNVSGNLYYTVNYIENNSFLTGTDGIPGGFNKAGNPTLYLFRESLTNGTNVSFISGNFRGVQNINQTLAYNYLINNETGNFNLTPGTGYLFFFRGSTATSNPYTVGSAALAATLSTSGTLNIGQVIAKNWYTGASTLSYTAASPYAGLNLVGNPYASSINWDTFQTSTNTTGIFGTSGATGVSSVMYVLDPVSNNFGSYIQGSGGVGSAAFVSNIIASGQAFFVVANGTGDQLIFNESAKTTTQNTGTLLLMGTPVNVANNQFIRLWMGQTPVISDQTLIRFNNQATLAYSPALDAPYENGLGKVKLASQSSDQHSLSVNTVPLPKLQAESIPLDVEVSTDGIYNINLQDIEAIPQLYDIWIKDAYKSDSLNMRVYKTYSFNVYKSDSASFGPKRFTLLLRQNPAYAYQLINFTASKVPDVKQVQITWTTLNEGNYTNFTVERSIDGGKTFNVLAGVPATGVGSYSTQDSAPVIGQNLYRLEQQDVNNTITYSNVVTIQYTNVNSGLLSNNLSVYPNPVNSNMSLAIAGQTTYNSVSYNIKIMNSSGVVVKQATSAQPSWEGSVSNLQPGTYIVQVLNGKTDALVGQTKFVKL